MPSRVADEDIEAAETVDRFLDEALAERFVTNVAWNRQRRSTFGFHELDDLARVFLLGRQMIDRHIGALARESDRGGAAHAGIPAGHQSFAASEPT